MYKKIFCSGEKEISGSPLFFLFLEIGRDSEKQRNEETNGKVFMCYVIMKPWKGFL